MEAGGGEWGAGETGRASPGPANAAPDRGGFGQVRAARALIGEIPDQVEPPSRIVVEEPANDENTESPVLPAMDQPPASAVLPEVTEQVRGDAGAPAANPAQFEIRQEAPDGESDWMRPSGATPGPVAIAQTVGILGGTPAESARRGVAAGMVGETRPVPVARADMIEGSVAQTDRGGAVLAVLGQAGRGEQKSPSAVPELMRREILAQNRAESAVNGPSAAKSTSLADAPAKDQVAPNPALPAVSHREESRPQTGGQHQVASGATGPMPDGAPVRLAAVASNGGGVMASVDVVSLSERPVSKQVERTAQSEIPAARGSEPDPGTPVTAGSQITPSVRHPDATPPAIRESQPGEVDPIRSVEDVPFEPRVPEGPRNASDPGAVVRADQGRVIAVQIAEVLRASGNRAVELRLQPEELGRVSLTMSQEGGQLHVTLAAERPETLDLMRRHIDLLGEELRRLGHGAVQFSFEDGTGRNRERTSPPPGPGDQARVSDPVEPGPQAATVRSPPTGVPGSAGGMDIRM
jgi:hypothetical protein